MRSRAPGSAQPVRGFSELRARAKARTPALLGAFFLFATIMCGLAGASLLAPGGPLEAIWRFKPDEYRQLLALAPWTGAGFLGLAVAMALAGYGTWRRRLWGLRLAILIFAVNALADATRTVFGAAWQGAIGVAATGIVLWWLTRPKVRALFA
jgi:hypothetical protein